MIDRVEQLLAGTISPAAFLDGLARSFPLVNELAATPQDAIWHGEGNVRIHTEMVLRELIADLPAHPGLTDDDRHALVIGAALHDIGKARTTREKIVDGVVRIVSPRHAEEGRSYSAPRLAGFADVNDFVFQWALGIVGYHHHPRKLLAGRLFPGKFARIARSVPLRLLWIFERADIRGRICQDLEEQLETLDLFRLEAETMGQWDCDPYAGWDARIASDFAVTDLVESRYVLEAGRFLYEHSEIQTLEEAIGKTYGARSRHGRLIVMCGPSGSGKSTWIRDRLDGDRDIVSLDDLRMEVSGKRERQSDNGKVLQLARERLKESLRAKRTVVWDATTLRSDARLALVSLAHQYGAASELVCFAVDPDDLARRNRSRTHSVPAKILERQLDRFQWPDLWEAERVTVVRA